MAKPSLIPTVVSLLAVIRAIRFYDTETTEDVEGNATSSQSSLHVRTDTNSSLSTSGARWHASVPPKIEPEGFTTCLDPEFNDFCNYVNLPEKLECGDFTYDQYEPLSGGQDGTTIIAQRSGGLTEGSTKVILKIAKDEHKNLYLHDECEALRKLMQVEHVVRCEASCMADGVQVIATEPFVEGASTVIGSLDKLRVNGQPLTEEALENAAMLTFATVERMIKAGIIQRDLHGNVLYKEDGTPLFIDLNRAADLGASEPPQTVVEMSKNASGPMAGILDDKEWPAVKHEMVSQFLRDVLYTAPDSWMHSKEGSVPRVIMALRKATKPAKSDFSDDGWKQMLDEIEKNFMARESIQMIVTPKPTPDVDKIGDVDETNEDQEIQNDGDQAAKEQVSKQEEQPCFPSSAMVHAKGRGLVRIDTLQKGDFVLSVNDTGHRFYDEVSFYSLADSARKQEAFLAVSTFTRRWLRITASHHLPTGTDCCKNLKTASELRVGDVVWVVGDSNASPEIVKSIDMVVDDGLHSPVMLHGGHPVVDGIVTSFDNRRSIDMAARWLPYLSSICTAGNMCNLMSKAISLFECFTKGECSDRAIISTKTAIAVAV